MSYRNTQLLAVRIYSIPARPNFIARSGLGADTYVRVGSTNRKLSGADRQGQRRMGRTNHGAGTVGRHGWMGTPDAAG